MPNSLQSSAIGSPASRRATNCSLSSMTEHSFQGITPSSPPLSPPQRTARFSHAVRETYDFPPAPHPTAPSRRAPLPALPPLPSPRRGPPPCALQNPPFAPPQYSHLEQHPATPRPPP